MRGRAVGNGRPRCNGAAGTVRALSVIGERQPRRTGHVSNAGRARGNGWCARGALDQARRSQCATTGRHGSAMCRRQQTSCARVLAGARLPRRHGARVGRRRVDARVGDRRARAPSRRAHHGDPLATRHERRRETSRHLRARVGRFGAERARPDPRAGARMARRAPCARIERGVADPARRRVAARDARRRERGARVCRAGEARRNAGPGARRPSVRHGRYGGRSRARIRDRRPGHASGGRPRGDARRVQPPTGAPTRAPLCPFHRTDHGGRGAARTASRRAGAASVLRRRIRAAVGRGTRGARRRRTRHWCHTR